MPSTTLQEHTVLPALARDGSSLCHSLQPHRPAEPHKNTPGLPGVVKKIDLHRCRHYRLPNRFTVLLSLEKID